MKTAVVTMATGDYHEALLATSSPSMREYAARIGADFVALEPSGAAPEMQLFGVFGLMNKYNRVIILHADIIVRPDCPSLFDVVPEGEMGMFNEGAFVDRLPEMREIVRQFAVEISKWERQYFNTGVIVASRRHKFLFEPPGMDVHGFNVASLINLRIVKQAACVFHLPYKFNRMPMVDEITGEHRLASHIVHYSGVRRDIETNGMKLDLDNWAKAAPKFEYKRNILIKVHGGLGDEVCAEPVVRYIATKAYPGQNIVVKTWFPRLFSHLAVTTVGIDDPIPELGAPYYLMETLVPPEHPRWKHISANLMSGTDFMSQSCLRMILPDEDKQIRLAVDVQDVAEVMDVVGGPANDVVIVHPGRGWDSKTFPSSYWNEVIRGLVAAGHKVVVIGKYISDEQGLVDIDIPEGVVDARNLLSLGGLIGIISQAKTLVSNDSAPVHIAGAFGNKIVLIPTCKHPDHVLPVRNGNRRTNAVALYKKLIFGPEDGNPTEIHGKTIDKVPGNIMDYLPDPAAVVAAV